MTMNPVVHFEMPAADQKRVSEFYSTVFGWQMQAMGPEMGNYIVATTTESPDGRPKQPGTINGGFFPKADNPADYPMVVIGVENIKDHMEKVNKAGGKVIGEPVDIPGIGLYVSFTDTEGNRVNLLQPKGE